MIIRRLDSRAIHAVRTQLATLLLDAVADGHSLGFLAGLDDAQLDAYWSGVELEVARGSRVLLAASRNGLLVGSVQLDLCQKPNGSNRAELQKMLVHCTVRRRGVGTALLEAAEIEALSLRRGLLFSIPKPVPAPNSCTARPATPAWANCPTTAAARTATGVPPRSTTRRCFRGRADDPGRIPARRRRDRAERPPC